MLPLQLQEGEPKFKVLALAFRLARLHSLRERNQQLVSKATTSSRDPDKYREGFQQLEVLLAFFFSLLFSRPRCVILEASRNGRGHTTPILATRATIVSRIGCSFQIIEAPANKRKYCRLHLWVREHKRSAVATIASQSTKEESANRDLLLSPFSCKSSAPLLVDWSSDTTFLDYNRIIWPCRMNREVPWPPASYLVYWFDVSLSNAGTIDSIWENNTWVRCFGCTCQHDMEYKKHWLTARGSSHREFHSLPA